MKEGRFDAWLEPINPVTEGILTIKEVFTFSNFGLAVAWCSAVLSIPDTRGYRAVVHDRRARPGNNCRWRVAAGGRAEALLRVELDGSGYERVNRPVWEEAGDGDHRNQDRAAAE